jgi:dolichol-phosphate mannosyltransferase
LYHANGDAVVVMDADLQDPPSVVGQFIAAWTDGAEVAYGVRRARKEHGLKRLAYRGFYRLLTRLARRPIPVDSGDFCLMDRRVVDVLNRMPEKNRFVRGLRAWTGFRQVGIPYERAARHAGESKYTLGGLVQLAIDGLFSFSTTPLRLATFAGFCVSAVAFIGALFTLAQGLFPDVFAAYGLRPVPGFVTTVISILFIGGVQLICVGIIGEYVGRIYDEVKGRPLWVLRETTGWTDVSDASPAPDPSVSGPTRTTNP